MNKMVMILGVVALVANIAFADADIVFLVDESGSMSGEHAWLPGMVSSLEAKLLTAGSANNRYGLVGFGTSSHAANQVPHSHFFGTPATNLFGTAAEFPTIAPPLVTTGGLEDGWAAISYALSNYTFNAGSQVNFILVTDEDRDVATGYGGLTYANVLAALQAKNVTLNAVVNNALWTGATPGTGSRALGVSHTPNSYSADGSGGYIKAAGGSASSSTTKSQYIDLAWATNGAAWDLNQLRTPGNTSVSFTNAFIDIKVEEILVPVPGAALLGLLGLGTACHRLRRRRA